MLKKNSGFCVCFNIKNLPNILFLRYINVLFVSLVLDCIVFTQREREEMCIFEHYLRCDGAGLQLQQNQKRYTCRDVLYFHRGYIFV